MWRRAVLTCQFNRYRSDSVSWILWILEDSKLQVMPMIFFIYKWYSYCPYGSILGGFRSIPKSWGAPLFIIHFCLGFSLINHPATKGYHHGSMTLGPGSEARKANHQSGGVGEGHGSVVGQRHLSIRVHTECIIYLMCIFSTCLLYLVFVYNLLTIYLLSI